MANIKSAEKDNRQAAKRRARNRGAKARMRGAIKKLRSALEAGDAKGAGELLPATLRLIDGTARKGGIHANAAARYKSRLTRAVAAAQQVDTKA